MAGAGKNVIFDAKIVEIAQNHKTTEHLFCNSHRADVQNRVQNRDFQKIVDGDPTKITKMSRKIDTHEAIVEKH